jgi:hypothetical protein
MLIIRGGDDLVPLQTDAHIYHYRAVKQRFMETMRTFRKHRMPDPSESSHFGRWSDCAHEVLKQRLLREDHPAGYAPDGVGDAHYAEPLRRAVGAVGSAGANPYDRDDVTLPEGTRAEPAAMAFSPAAFEARDSLGGLGNLTLAEQARMLKPGTYKPGPGVYRIGRPRPAPPPVRARGEAPAAPTKPPAPVIDAPPPPMAADAQAVEEPTARPQYNRRASDAALQNLEFIGSATHLPGRGLDTAPPARPPLARAAPAPSLRDPRSRMPEPENFISVAAPEPILGKSPDWSLPTAPREESMRAAPRPVPPLEPARPDSSGWSAIDMDATHLPSPPPGLTTSELDLGVDIGFGVEEIRHGFGQAASEQRQRARQRPFSDGIFNDDVVSGEAPEQGGFSNSLITSENYDT